MEIKIDTDKPIEKKWKPLGDWRYMLAMAIVLAFTIPLGRGQNPLAMNWPALIGTALGPCVVFFVVWLFNKD